MNIYIIIGIIGVISGVLCARADIPLAWSGRRGDKVDIRNFGKVAECESLELGVCRKNCGGYDRSLDTCCRDDGKRNGKRALSYA